MNEDTFPSQLPTSVDEVVELTLADLELRPLSKRTYRCGLQAFLRFLKEEKHNGFSQDALAPYPISLLSEDTLSEFNRWLRRTYKPKRAASRRIARDQSLGETKTRTQTVYLVAARHLMNWLDLNELLPEDVSYERMVRLITSTRGRRRQAYVRRPVDPDVIRVLTYYQRQELPEKPLQRRLIILRNRALMAFLYDTATRVSEALALTREDVLDGRAYKVRLTITKNGRPRTVFISNETRHIIQEYVSERTDDVYAPLFVSHGRNRGSALTPAHAWNIVKEATKAEGLYQNTSPHSLRHRRAQDLLDEGMPLEWVAALLGHERPDTTRIVYAWETDEERLGDMIATYGHTPSEAASQATKRD